MTKNTQSPLAVIKVGGDMLSSADDRQALAKNIKDLIEFGWQCVVLHGGGPQLNVLQKLHGLSPKKIEGRRVTSPADLVVVKQALCGEVNVDLVSALLAEGVQAFGCHGASGRLVKALKRPPMKFAEHGEVDMGEVGDVVGINDGLIKTLLSVGLTPVIATLGVDSFGRVFNINADTTVSAIAKALKAQLLILSTKVGGIFTDIDDPSTRIETITPSGAKNLIDQGVITDGMIPKVNESMALLDAGVNAIAIANASQAGTFKELAQGSHSVGTRLTSD